MKCMICGQFHIFQKEVGNFPLHAAFQETCMFLEKQHEVITMEESDDILKQGVEKYGNGKSYSIPQKHIKRQETLQDCLLSLVADGDK